MDDDCKREIQKIAMSFQKISNDLCDIEQKTKRAKENSHKTTIIAIAAIFVSILALIIRILVAL